MLNRPQQYPQHYDRFLRLPEVSRTTGLARTQIYDLTAKGEFPRPVKRGRSSLWPESAVQDWIARLKAEASARGA